ncbi:hypothetical protein Tco_0311889 [Tanacetum coccineum]
MSTLTFSDTNNMVAFLEKTTETDGFHEIIDFLNANQIHYALTVNPTIYTPCIKQFWATTKIKTVNRERQIQALVDKKKVIIIESSIRSDLHLEDADGTNCLPTATIFEDADANEEFVPTHSNDPLLSGKDRLKLTDLMDMCTKLCERVLDLEHTKTAQAQEITNLKLRVKKLEKKTGLRTHKFKRLYKVGLTRRVEYSADESLGAQEDAFNQGRSIEDIDKDDEVSLVDETQGRSDDAEMFNTNALIGNEVFAKNDMIEKAQDVIPKEVSTAAPSTTIVSPPVITKSTATTAPLTIPKAKGITFRDAGESTTRTPTSVSSSSIKDKGKAKMDEPEVPLKKKDQIALAEEMARNLEAQIQAELIEEERLARKKEKEANIALIESWDNTQAVMEVDFELAQRLQAEEQGEIAIEERSRLFVELMNKRKKHFVKLRAEEKRRKPPTKAQKRNLMSTYLKNMGGYKYNQLKSKSYDEIQKLFDNEMKRVNTFIPMDSEVMKSKEGIEESSKRIEDELKSDKSKKAESSKKKAEGSGMKSIGKKRAGKEQKQESSKRQRIKDDKEIDEHEEAEEDDEGEMKKHMEIVKEGQKGFYHFIRADGSSNRYSPMIRMLQNISREDLETLWKLVKTKHGNIRPEDVYEKVLWGDLKVMFEPDIKSEIWMSLQGYKVIVWKLTAGTKVNAAGLQLLEELLLSEG